MRFAWLLYVVTFAVFITARKGTDTCVKPFTPNPVGFWPMNSQSMTEDASENRNDGFGHNLVLAEGPSGEKDTALAFSGNSNCYMDIQTSSALDVGARGSFSYTGFIKLNRTGGYVWAWSGSTPQSAILIGHQRLHVVLQRPDTAEGFVDPRLPRVELNRWLFIGVSYDYTNLLLRVKINEEDLVIPMPRLLPRTNGSVIFVGKQPNETVSDANAFRGSMSCLMLFDIALEPSDMERVRAYCLMYNALVQSHTPCAGKMGEHGKVSPQHPISFSVLYHKKHFEGDVSHLVSGAIHSNGPRCLMFRYKIFGPDDTFNVYLMRKGEPKVLVWSMSGMTSRLNTGSVQINMTGQYKIIFEDVHFSINSDITVDYAYLGDGPCPKVNYLSHVGGHLRSDHEAWLFSPMIQSSGPRCLLFYYQLLGDNRNTLNVYIMRDHNLGPAAPVWSSADQPPSWNVGLVRINATGDYKVAFQGVRELKPSDIVVGNPLVGDGPCPTGGVYQLTQPHEHFPAESRLISSELSSNGPKCLMFFYKISGQKRRTLMVYVIKKHATLPPVWSKTARRTGQWILGMVQINTTGEYKVVIEGIRGPSDHKGDIAIEHLMIHNGPCHKNIGKALNRETVKTTTAVPINFTTQTPDLPNIKVHPTLTSAYTQKPTTTTQLPKTSTQPTATTQPPTTTTQPPTTQPHITAKVPTTTTQPSTTTTQSPTTQLNITTKAPKTTTQPPTTTTQLPTTQPPTTTTQPPTTQPHITTKVRTTTTQPSTTTHPHITTTQPPVTTHSRTSTQVPTTTTQVPTTTIQPHTTTQLPTTTTPPGTTTNKRLTTTGHLETPPTTAMPPTVVVPTVQNTTIPTAKRIKMSFKLGGKFNSDLKNPSSPAYKKLKRKMLKLMAKVYGGSHLAGAIKHIRIIGFKEGSIVVITEVVADPAAAAKTNIHSHDIAHALKDYVKKHKKTAVRLGIDASSIKAKVRKTTTVKPATTSIKPTEPTTKFLTTTKQSTTTTLRQTTWFPSTTTQRPTITTAHQRSTTRRPPTTTVTELPLPTTTEQKTTTVFLTTTRQPTTTTERPKTTAEPIKSTRRQPTTTTERSSTAAEHPTHPAMRQKMTARPRLATANKRAGSGSGSLKSFKNWILSMAFISAGWIVLLTI